MISVVMATYNGEKYIRQQLESIWNQTLLPDEIIISDDSSTDCTVDILHSLKTLAKVPYCLFQNPKRLGYVENFRHAISQAHGDIIFLCDQDDLWFPQKIEICNQILSENPQILSLSTGIKLIDSQDRPIKTVCYGWMGKTHRLKKVSWKLFLRHPKYPGMAMVIRKELAEEFNASISSFSYPHDWQLNELASFKGGMYYLDTVLASYRQHSSNTVGTLSNMPITRSIQKREEYLLNMCSCLYYLEKARNSSTYLNRLSSFYRKRYKLFHDNKVVVLFIYSVCHLQYISVRSLIGDLYLLFKGKWRK
ncbi:glycosyltransferase [Clostridium sp. AF18-27]|uniref:glycosyltransferase n=1 Tax=Enterocloster lavalensis TaxID=460384 RepID=UPI000E4C96D2|nr:glycosyltransferase [Enterocloster lavalensis]RHR51889.1 glycosyltransferase [Clostridium sp. AF18-27]